MKIRCIVKNKEYSTYGEVIYLREAGDCEGVKLYNAIDDEGKYTIKGDEDQELMNCYIETDFVRF